MPGLHNVSGAKVVLVMAHTSCGAIKIAGAMYDLQTGVIDFFA